MPFGWRAPPLFARFGLSWCVYKQNVNFYAMFVSVDKKYKYMYVSVEKEFLNAVLRVDSIERKVLTSRVDF